MNKYISYCSTIYRVVASSFFCLFQYQSSCIYIPTCSQYMEESIHRFGWKLGLLKGVHRIFRCHPWHEGGVDLVG